MARPTLLLRARAQGRDTVRRLVAGIAMIVFLIAAAPVSAAGQGFQPPNAKVHNHSLTDLAVAWTIWGFGSPEDENPLLASRCEQSPIDPKIWFLPVSLGGDMEVDCQIPKGAFLVFTRGRVRVLRGRGKRQHGSRAARMRRGRVRHVHRYRSIAGRQGGEGPREVRRERRRSSSCPDRTCSRMIPRRQ